MAGRTESLQMDTGDAANRVITSTLIPAIAVLTALVAAQIAGRVKPVAYLALGLPALVIAVLAFSRNTLLSVGWRPSSRSLPAWAGRRCGGPPGSP